MSKIIDQTYLLQDQYCDAANLDARVQLHVKFSINKYGWNRWHFDQLDLPEDARVLEIGCGPGYLWRDNLDRIPADWDITLSDFSEGMLKQAQRNLSGRPFRFEQIDAQAIPFDAGSVDAVIANHMLYHVPDRAKALSEFRRVLKPAGKAYLATNGARHLQEFHALMRRFDPRTDFGWGKRASEQFSLDNGGAEVQQWFASVDVRRYEDALIVTEAKPLVDYSLSMTTVNSATRRAELTAFVEHELQLHGAIHIAKESGVFIAQP